MNIIKMSLLLFISGVMVLQPIHLFGQDGEKTISEESNDPEKTKLVSKVMEIFLDEGDKEAADKLARIGKAAVAPLIESLNHPDIMVRRRAAWALGRIGDKRAIAPLILLLKDQSHMAQKYAASALGAIGDPTAVPHLIEALKSTNERTREEVVTALGEIGDIRAVSPLIGALRDDSRIVRRQAAESLGKLESKDAVLPLIKHLQGERAGWSIVWALGEIGDKRAVEPLIWAMKNQVAYIRDDIMQALGKLGDYRALDSLNTLLRTSDDGMDNVWAAWAVFKISREAKAFAFLLKALKDEDEDVRETSAKALGKLADPRALETLLIALKDKKEDVRRAAATALGSIRDRKAVPHLIAVLGTGKKWERIRSTEALQKITGQKFRSYEIDKWKAWWERNE